MELHIPKLREGSYFPSLLEPRRRSEKALLSVIQQAYVEGVSTRRVDDLIKALGCDGISSSQVSRICQQLDEVVESFLGRPLDGGPYPYVWLDGLTQKVREGGRIVNVCVVVATGVNAEGQREILGMDVGASEDGAFWLAFLRSLTARGLSGVELVTSDAHQGLKNAIAAVFAGASWQRCRHPLHGQPAHPSAQACPPELCRRAGVATMVRTIYQQLSPAEVHGQLDRVVEQLREPFAQVAELLADAAPDILAFTAFPVAHWQKLWSNNPQERLNREIRRRTDVVGIFPNRLSARRLVGAVLPSSMTSGAKPAATSPSPTPPATRHCRRPICWKQRPDQHQQGRRAFTLLDGTLPMCKSGPVMLAGYFAFRGWVRKRLDANEYR